MHHRVFGVYPSKVENYEKACEVLNLTQEKKTGQN